MKSEKRPKFEEGNKLNQEDKIEILKEQDVVSFDINLTPEEKRCVEEVSIEKKLPQFNYYGPLNEELVRNLTVYFGGLGKNSEEVINTISGLVARVAKNATRDFDKESAWVMVRTSLPNNDFDVPRWHPDGKYFKPFDSKDKTYKLVMTIKGALTRFGEKIDLEKFEQLLKESSNNYELNHNNPEALKKDDIRIRKELDSVIKEIKPSKEGEAVYYLVGHDGAKIHSEPKIDKPRIFMSVVAGSNDQVDELKERWNKK